MEDRDDISLFQPSKKSMTSEYPELNGVSEFADLRDTELKFVWFYSCSSSPYIKLPEKERAKIALKESKYEFSLKQLELQNALNGRFLPKIVEAITVMKTFQPSLRSVAKETRLEMLENIIQMSKLPRTTADGTKTLEVMEIADRVKYADFVKTSTSVIDILVEQIEKSGISKKQKAANTKGPNLMDRIIAED